MCEWSASGSGRLSDSNRRECMEDPRPNEIHGDNPKMEANEGKSASAQIMRIDRHHVGSKEDKGMCCGK